MKNQKTKENAKEKKKPANYEQQPKNPGQLSQVKVIAKLLGLLCASLCNSQCVEMLSLATVSIVVILNISLSPSSALSLFFISPCLVWMVPYALDKVNLCMVYGQVQLSRHFIFCNISLLAPKPLVFIQKIAYFVLIFAMIFLISI